MKDDIAAGGKSQRMLAFDVEGVGGGNGDLPVADGQGQDGVLPGPPLGNETRSLLGRGPEVGEGNAEAIGELQELGARSEGGGGHAALYGCQPVSVTSRQRADHQKAKSRSLAARGMTAVPDPSLREG
jgi:hypothetical protein